MKTTVDGKEYLVIKLRLETNSNYNVGIHIIRMGEMTPICGTSCKKTDNVKEIATQLIKGYETKVHCNSL